MTYLKKTAFLGLFAVSFLFRAGTAQAIPIPTIGGELATQIDQLTKHIDELKKVKDQITNGVEQAKAMGDKLSMEALKNFAKSQGKSALSGGIAGLKVPQEMTQAGFTDQVAEDPEQITDWISKMKTEGKEGGYDFEKRQLCLKARDKMAEELATAGLANSLALQNNLASGEDMKKAQEATGASDDQMQLLGANSATLKVMYQQAASSTVMEANRLASASIATMCN